MLAGHIIFKYFPKKKTQLILLDTFGEKLRPDRFCAIENGLPLSSRGITRGSRPALKKFRDGPATQHRVHSNIITWNQNARRKVVIQCLHCLVRLVSLGTPHVYDENERRSKAGGEFD